VRASEEIGVGKTAKKHRRFTHKSLYSRYISQTAGTTEIAGGFSIGAN